jgi:UDP-N-acetyl-D-glucosamine dehydrogenase
VKEVNSRNVAVIGLGYVGLPLALHIAKYGTKVVGYDINSDLISSLKLGKSPYKELSEDVILDLLHTNDLGFTDNQLGLRHCDTFIVCVPTPTKSDRSVDLTHIQQVVELLTTVAPSESLIINESTSFPGTLKEIFYEGLFKGRPNEKFYFATAPERIDPGNSTPISDITRVVGGVDQKSTELATAFYSRYFQTVHPVSSAEVAEVSKLLENSFRQVNISFINELNHLCRKAGIDTREVIDAAATKPYGFMKFSPSAGIGGHCIPVDPEYLQHFARRFGLPLSLIGAASDVNSNMGNLIFDRIKDSFQNSIPSTSLILGVAYKANVADTRDTAAKLILDKLVNSGISCKWHDPLVRAWQGESSTPLNSGTWDFGLVVTAHDDLDIIAAKKSCRVIFDCTGSYSFDPEIVQI